MFGSKKRLKEIEEAKQQLENEKQELLFIKNQLEDSTPKINVSNIFVWQDKGLYSIVKLNVQKIHGRTWGGIGKESDGYQSTLTDIFTNNIVYERCSTDTIQRKQYISGKNLEDGYFAFLLPLHNVDVNLLAYTDKKVPLFVLQQLYYRLNKVDVNAYILKKQK